MSVFPLTEEMGALVGLLHKGAPVSLGAIPWASPIPAFGNPFVSRVATLGLNPSNLEFVDSKGQKLLAPHNRLESLETLHVRNWGDVAAQGIQRVWNACENYFFRNPYNQWFKPLERILSGTGASYYSRVGRRACHLDLVPFATGVKWSSIDTRKRACLLELGVPSLIRTIQASNVRVLVLNGSAVVREWNRLLGPEKLQAHEMPEWDLQGGRVKGVAHIGRVAKLNHMSVNRELLVLGYNHNIQSSFGVTRSVVSSIAAWVARESAEVLE